MASSLSPAFLPSGCEKMDATRLAHLYGEIFFTEIPMDIVKSAMSSVCGSKVLFIDQHQLVPVLQTIHDMLVLEEEAYWDFRVLAVDESQTLPPADALLFMQVIHGSNFSTELWTSFQKSRHDPVSNVSWYEIKPWIINPPSVAKSCEQTDSGQLTNEILQQKEENDVKFLENYNEISKDRQLTQLYNHEKQLRDQAEVMLKVWDDYNIEKYIDPDSVGHQMKWTKHGKVKASIIRSLIEQKYEAIRVLLVKDMVVQSVGPDDWSAYKDNDLVQMVLAKERSYRQDNALSTKYVQLDGSLLPATFTPFSSLQGKAETEELMGSLDSSQEKAEFNSLPSGARVETYGEYLVALAERQKTELVAYDANAEKFAGKERIVYYCQLQRQHLALKARHNDFTMTALSVGLTERSPNLHQSKLEEARYNSFVSKHLSTYQKYREFSTETNLPSNAGVQDYLDCIVGKIFSKHQQELSALVWILNNRKTKSARSARPKSSAGSRELVIREMVELRNRRKAWRDEKDGTAGREGHMRILEQALGIFYENQADKLKSQIEASKDVMIINLLLQKQGEEFMRVIHDISNKQALVDLQKVLKYHEKDMMYEYCDNIADILFSGVECSERDKHYVTALQEKYKQLRQQIIKYYLPKKHGDSWYSRPVHEQQRLIAQLSSELKIFQDQGKIHEMDAKVHQQLANISIQEFLGENRLEFSKRLSSKDFLAEENPAREAGVFASLHERYYSEYAAVLEVVHKLGEADPEVLLALIKSETFIVEHSDDFKVAGVQTGLLERIVAAKEKRHEADMTRIRFLSKCLVANHQFMVQTSKKYIKMKAMSAHENASVTALLENLYKEVLLKHCDERYILLKIALDPTLGELRAIANRMTKEEKYKRLALLQNRQRFLDFDKQDAREDNMMILEELAAIKMCIMLDASHSQDSEEDIATKLTEELIHLQDKEFADIHSDTCQQDVTSDEVRDHHKEEALARKYDRSKNVAKVLSSYFGTWTEGVIFSALDAKYIALESLLLQSALKKTNNHWDRLSIADRTQLQKRLKDKTDQLKLQEGGDEKIFDEYRGLYKDERSFSRTFGDNSFEFTQSCFSRVHSDASGQDDHIIVVMNPLQALTERKDEEYQMYHHLLRGMIEVYIGERGRMTEVLALRLYRLIIEKHQDIIDCSLFVGLLERSHIVSRLSNGAGGYNLLCKSDWSRTVQLSVATINTGKPVIPDIDFSSQPAVDSSSPMFSLMEETLQQIIARQKQEVTKLLRLMHNLPQSSMDSARSLLFGERMEKLANMLGTFGSKGIWKEEDLITAIGLKLQIWSDTETEYTAQAYLLAELIEKQLFELANLFQFFSQKQETEIHTYRDNLDINATPQIIHALTDLSRFTKDINEQITDAIKDKYDALKDKLMLEALQKQYGDAEWAAQSEAEKQRRLMELKRKEKQLRQQGLDDEAADLVNKYLDDSETLKKLLGDEKEELERRMKERLQRKRERINNGMSNEEAEALEKEESEKDEKAVKERRRDILKNLDYKCDAELDKIMAEMNSLKDEEDRERKAQEELARIRRQNRRLKKEEKFGAAAALLQMVSDKERDADDERKLQEQLARERMMARRRKGRQSHDQQADDEVESPVDMENLDALREAVLTQLELKHKEEREFLLSLSDQASSKEYHIQASSASQRDREMKIEELKLQRKHIREAKFFDKDEQADVLQEAMCYQLLLRSTELEANSHPSAGEDVIASLLADLQEVEDHEIESVIHEIHSMSAKSLVVVKTTQMVARKQHWYDNVADVLLEVLPGGSKLMHNSDEEVISVLEQKYDTIKDTIIMEALMQRMGETVWNALNEKEQQKKLMEIKLKEKQLRKDGKLDEARQLLEGLFMTEIEMIGDRVEQEELWKERAKQLKERLTAEDTPDEDKDFLKNELEQLETKIKRYNALENLENDYEADKRRLMALINSQKDEASAERLKQLEMAKLRRQKKLLQQHGQLDEASALIDMALKNEEIRKAGMKSDMELQMELARKRLEARRAKAAKGETTPCKSPEVSEHLIDASTKVQDRLFDVVETWHDMERNLVISFCGSAEDDAKRVPFMRSMSIPDLRYKLEDEERKCQELVEQIKGLTTDTTRIRNELHQSLKHAFQLSVMAQLKSDGVDEDAGNTDQKINNIYAKILATVQEKQDEEVKQANDVMLNEPDESLEKLVEVYVTNNEKGLVDNVISGLFSVLDDEEVWADKSYKDVEKKYEEEKKQLLDQIEAGVTMVEKNGQKFDPQELLRKLEADHAQSMQELDADRQRQHDLLLARRRTRKQAVQDSHHNIVRQLLSDVESQQVSQKSAADEAKSKQDELMKQRLAQRRAGRVKQQEKEQRQELIREELANPFGVVSQMVGLGVKRQRTVIQVSEEKTHQQYTELKKSQEDHEKFMDEERRRQEEMMKLKRQIPKKLSEAQAIISKGEREKTIFLKSKDEEKDKQMSEIKQRFARIKNEKTIVAKSGRTSTAFESLVNAASAAGLSTDDQMKQLAANIEKRFADESQNLKEGKTTLKIGDDEDDEATQSLNSSKKLTEEEKLQILKERRAAKRKAKAISFQKQESNE